MPWKKANPGCPACGVECWTVTDGVTTRNVFDAIPPTLYAKIHATSGSFSLSDIPLTYRRNWHKYDGEPNEIAPTVVDITSYVLAWFSQRIEITFTPTVPEADPCEYTSGEWNSDNTRESFSYTFSTLPGDKVTTVCFPFISGSQYQAISNFDEAAWANSELFGVELPGSVLPSFSWGNSAYGGGSGPDGDVCNLTYCNYDACDSIPIGGYGGVETEYTLHFGPAIGTCEFNCFSLNFSAEAPGYFEMATPIWEVIDVANPCGGADIQHVTEIETIHAFNEFGLGGGVAMSFVGMLPDDPLDQWSFDEFPLPLGELVNIKFHFDRVDVEDITPTGGKVVTFPNAAPDDGATIIQWWAFDAEFQSLIDVVDFEGTELDENTEYPCGPSGPTLPAPYVEPAGYKVVENPYVLFGCKLTGVYATLSIDP